MTWYARGGKRIFDLVVAIVLVALLSPIYAVVALIVLATLGRPLLFRQERPGRRARPFALVKFRTMRPQTRVRLSDVERLTRSGRWLRASSLDELPELWNVIRGEMSLVGPRPLLTIYLDRYSEEQSRRHEARPGMTGWSQVNGRNSAPWDQRLAMDVWYVDHVSLGLDLKILLMTLWRVLQRRGVTEAGHATVSEFRGTPERR